MDIFSPEFISIFAISAGLVALLLSLKPATQLCKHSQTHKRHWKVLQWLLYGFVAGYCVTLSLFTILQVTDAIKIASATILSGGGLFVWIVLNLSLKTVLASQELEEKNRYASLHNILTALPNDRMLMEEFSANHEEGQSKTLISIRIQKFQPVANVLGYQRGNELLVKVANRLQSTAGHENALFDLGNCHFAVLISQSDNDSTVTADISNAMIEPFIMQQSSVQLDCYLGVARFPEHGNDIDTLLSHANMAANEARKEAIPCYEYWYQLGEQLEERLEIAEQLREAIKNNELELHYQPIFTGTSGWMRSVEVLIRWPQADGSYISPEIFIPVAEQERTIHLVTQWVFENAFQQLSSWLNAGLDLTMNINLSSHDLVHNDFIDHLEQKRRHWRIQPDRLVLEITESAVMTDFSQALGVLSVLDKAGYRLAIDDFGTGYSSMSRLKHLPITHIKIDREFVMELHNNKQNSSIVSATNSIAQAFGCSVTAEGVESGEAADELVELGCNYLQGFHLSRPLTAEAATAALHENRKFYSEPMKKVA